MDKNQSVVMVVVAVFIIVGIFIYFVFASNGRDITEEMQEDTVNNYSIDIDGEVIDYIDSESTGSVEQYVDNNGDAAETNEDIISYVDSDSKYGSVVDSQQEVDKKQDARTTVNASAPNTGSGSIVVIIASVLGIISAGVVYKKQTKTQR